jgi:carboxypeptidase family protein
LLYPINIVSVSQQENDMRLPQALCLLSLAVASLAADISAQSLPNKNSDNNGGTIIGAVTAQGKPLPGVTITLWQQPLAEPTASNMTKVGSTNADGSYELTGVPPGNYFISASLPGYVTGKENQIFANLRPVNAVTDGKVDRVDLDLIREGVISGVVTDADGKPVGRIPITITTEVTPAGAGPPKYAKDLRTDEQGNYRITGLPPGKYRVAAGHYPVTNATLFGRVGYRRMFYGDTTDESQAKTIDIAPGADIKIDLNVGSPVKTFTVSATIVDSQSGQPVTDMGYDVRVFENGKTIGGAGTRGRSNDKGEIVIEHVPPGEYMIVVPHVSGTLPVNGEIPQPPNIFGESKHFEVIDKDLGGVEVRVTKAATLSGFVTIEGNASADIRAKLSQMRVIGMMIMSPIMHASINPDGSFMFKGLRAGKLEFQFTGPPGKEPLPLRFVRAERDGIRLDQAIEVQGGDQITGVRLILAYANSTIHGVVKLNGGPFVNGAGRASVLGQDSKFPEFGDLDSRGEFVLSHLPAGRYKVIVVVRYPNGKSQNIEKQVTVADDAVAEITIDAGNPN